MSAAADVVVEKEIISAKTLMKVAARNCGVIRAQAESVTHEQSLLQPPIRGNCMNWVVGHIVQSRDRMLRLVGLPMLWTPEQIARYERDSAPILDGHDALPFEKMLADLAVQQGHLNARLQTITRDELDAIGVEAIKGITTWTVAEWLQFLLWHETYHLGNLEILRQLAGKNDKVI